MLTDLYVFGDSIIHRMRPVFKIAALIVLCTSLFVVERWAAVVAAGAVVATGFLLARLRLGHAFASLRPAIWILAAIFAVQAYLASISFAAFVVFRLTVIILAAALVTLSTRTSELVDGILAALHHAPKWVPKRRIALAISLSLRFIPVVRSVLLEVREAQKARGLGRHPTALLVPLIVRTLKTADDVSQAIYSRSFD